MKRWYVKFNDSMTLKLYYPSEEKISEQYPDCQEIKECLEVGYLDYIDKILKLSIAQRNDFKGRMIHKIPYNSGYIDVRFGYDNQDCMYYNFLEYRLYEKGDVENTATWIKSTPQEFYNTFLCHND